MDIVVEGLIFKIQALPLRASLTFQFFLKDASKIRGTISMGLRPSSQGELQNSVVAPFPIVMVVEA